MNPDDKPIVACAGANIDLFFPPARSRGGASYAEARRLCDTCPSKAPCLEQALKDEARTTGPRAGMAGGRTPRERAAIAEQRKRGRR